MSLKALYMGALVALATLVVAACSSPAPAAAPAAGGAAPPAAPAQKKSLTVGTATTGGAFYAYGAAAANIIRSKGVTIDAVSQQTQGSNENVTLLNTKQVDLAIVQGDVVYETFHGEAGRQKMDNLRGLYAGLPMAFYAVIPKDSPVKSLSDLKGKVISVPSKGQGGYTVTAFIFEALGIKFEDFKDVRYGSVGEAVTAYKDRHTDAMMMTAGVPQPAFMELPTSPRGMNVVPFSDEEIKKITSKASYYAKGEIPGGVYAGMDKAVQVPVIWAGLVTTTDMSDDVAYQVVKTISENHADLEASYSAAKFSTAESTANFWQIIPLHNGAKKYLTEKGLIK